ncbi:MAG TPA: DinB family protein [Planococcus sp. (in: firmicutes)]|nr:DinB family protein [Planococcus sp. (in: firmicutes)]
MDRNVMFSYHQWASQEMLNHIQALDDGIYDKQGENSFSSIKETLQHVIGVEKMWFMRMNGIEKPEFEHFEISTPEGAKESFMLLHAEMELFFSSLTEERWKETMSFQNRKGKSFQNTREEMHFTFINHASYHRGQITSFLRQFGKEGIPLDFIYYKGAVPPENKDR